MQKLLSAIRSIAGDVFVFQQNNAPAHRARDTVELLRCETPQFISPDMWPANCPDLNPVDYHVWSMLQEHVYPVRIRDTDELRKRLVATWAEFQQSVADDAVDQWRKRLEACIRAEGGHFEHLLWRCLLDIPVATHHNRFLSEPPVPMPTHNQLFSEPPTFGGTEHCVQSEEKV